MVQCEAARRRRNHDALALTVAPAVDGGVGGVLQQEVEEEEVRRA
jgi:hypothetical protein